MKRIKRRGQSLLEFLFFIPLFVTIFVISFMVQWSVNASISHQQNTRAQVFYIMSNSRDLPFRHRETNPLNGPSIANNNFYIGYSAQPASGGNVNPVPSLHKVGFEEDSFANPKEIKVRTVYGICTETRWIGATPWVAEENRVGAYGGQDPEDMCR